MIFSSVTVSETGKTIRYAVGSNARTVRLAVLMLIAVLGWHLLL
jgi:hypothetical protein